jgi:serine/threonine protein kinase
MGVGNQANLVYLIDFGLSKEYRYPDTRAHIPFDSDVGFTGTTAFASINSHMGMELGRRDDLESLTYVLFYFLWGSLPWQGLGEEEAILESKRTITMHTLFLALPAELQTFYEYCRSLSFDEKPNYDHFYNLFGELILREGFQLDMAIDWDVTGGKSQPDCTDKSVAPQHECYHSPKRVTRYVPRILSTHYQHTDNGLYADCALSVARKNIHLLVSSHASSSSLFVNNCCYLYRCHTTLLYVK